MLCPPPQSHSGTPLAGIYPSPKDFQDHRAGDTVGKSILFDTAKAVVRIPRSTRVTSLVECLVHRVCYAESACAIVMMTVVALLFTRSKATTPRFRMTNELISRTFLIKRRAKRSHKPRHRDILEGKKKKHLSKQALGPQ